MRPEGKSYVKVSCSRFNGQVRHSLEQSPRVLDDAILGVEVIG